MTDSGVFELRRVEPTDLPTLLEHRRLFFEEFGNADAATLADHIRIFRRWLQPRLKSGSVVGWIATADGVPAGSGLVYVQSNRPHPWNRTGRSPYLMAMYTQPAHRRQGIATAIVRAALNCAKDAGFSSMTLHATDAGRPVYEALGFVRGGEMWRSLKDWE